MLSVPIPTIRSWERRYGFPEPARTSGKHRRYSVEQVQQLRELRDTITLGHAAGEAVEIVRRGEAGAPHRDRRIDELLGSAMHLDPNAARAQLDDATETLGVEAAVAGVAVPAMREVGERWMAGTCDAANEHLLTDAVRAWLARLTTLAPLPMQPWPVVLACGPKELHTVGLESFGLLLTRRGRPVVNLGALTPVESLRTAIGTSRAAAAVVVAQRSVNRKSTIGAIEAANELLGPRAFYAGGAFATDAARRDVPGVYLGTDLGEAVRAVDLAISSG
jgi:MerR family transcriptional regulator, light-induced transcriptional regulator